MEIPSLYSRGARTRGICRCLDVWKVSLPKMEEQIPSPHEINENSTDNYKNNTFEADVQRKTPRRADIKEAKVTRNVR